MDFGVWTDDNDESVRSNGGMVSSVKCHLRLGEIHVIHFILLHNALG
jgi:hypothetical protein